MGNLHGFWVPMNLYQSYFDHIFFFLKVYSIMIKLFPCIIFSKLQIKLVCLLFLLVDCWGSAKVYVDENITGKRNILIQYICAVIWANPIVHRMPLC